MKAIIPTLRGGIAVLCLALGGCVSMDNHRNHHPDPYDRLSQLMGLYQEQRRIGSSCDELWKVSSPSVDCQRIQREVERLYAEFPNDSRIMIANATLQFQAGRLDKAQFTLDQLLSKPGSHPEAALLRSQISMLEGNSSRARAVLQQQIELRPDYHELREALAATYYIEGKYESAQRALNIAGRLGAPGWRISYHHGLIQEAQENWSRACSYYMVSLEQKHNFTAPANRLIGLSHNEACRSLADRRAS
ncbi:tetratricopeptide repeat protein [Spongiibacter sp. KMU-166]|uniref:Tetratricopeptide repeat protein n=1 Tax=Spongiibacter thalassae TaxID=2721624 RepID=A0ABX1GKA9_9GAMM|nr:tetratricopeptide repeat protein [Spongiibacter thalassae]NKI19351.1 tetratricopeptide repeat protein [Spongiibacter thalassae]